MSGAGSHNPIRWIVAALAILAALVHGPVRAQLLRLEVTRSGGAESCPDVGALEAEIARIGGPGASANVSTRYRVDFSREPTGFRASIRAGALDVGERVLRARGSSCSALAQATAVTLALLFESDKELPAPALVPQPTAAVAAPPPIDSALPQRASSRRDWSVGLALGAAASIGVLAPIAPALSGELDFQSTRWRLGLGAHWIIPQSRDLDRGSVRETLLNGIARGCFAGWRNAANLRLELCSGAWLGVLSARSEGFTRDAHAGELWLALPIELTFSSLRGPVGWELSAAALVPLRRHDFEVEGAGVAYRSASVAASISLRAIGLWPWDASP